MIFIRYRRIKRKLILKKYFIDFVGIVIGSIIMAISTSFFLLPNQLSTGGFSGIATIIYYLFNLEVGTVMIILNIPLLLFGLFRIGK